MTQRWRSVVLAVLMLGSVMAGSVGPAMGQTTGAYTHTFTSGAQYYYIDLGSYEGQVNIRFQSPEHEAPDNTVYANTLSTTQIDSNRLALYNMGAYDNLTVTITGPSDPSYDAGGDLSSITGGYYGLGSTGGDVDDDCNNAERISQVTVGRLGNGVIDCTGYPGIASINTTDTDANQTEKDIYQDALDAQASTNATLTILSNYLNDSQTTARIRGQNAYIRALNNGSSEAAARAAATSAIADYYAVKQRNLISAWNTALTNYLYVRGVAQNESGISASEFRDGETANFVGVERAFLDLPYGQEAEFVGSGQASLSLANGESAPVTSYNITFSEYGNYADWVKVMASADYTPANAPVLNVTQRDEYTTTSGDLLVRPPNSNYDQQTVLDPQRFADAWSDIQEQNQQVQSDLDIIVNNTYNEYQQGDINNSDLVDPYTLTRRSPGDGYQSWAAAQMTAIGVNSPEALESTGAFNITHGTATYTGILFVTEDTEISAGETYNSSNLNGTEYIVTSETTVELTGTWTVNSITTAQGETVNNATYQDTTYQSANVSQLIQNYQNLLEERAEIEARERVIINNSGVPSSGGDSPDIDPTYLLAGAGALVVVGILLNQ